MALLQRDEDKTHTAPASRIVQDQPTSTAETSITDELLAEADEPPDERLRTMSRASARPLSLSRATSEFEKTVPPRFQRKESLLTTALHISETEPRVDTAQSTSSAPKRGLSTASISTTSTAELTSDSGPTSAGTRASTPSPILAPTQLPGFAPLFDNESFKRQPIIRHDDIENIGPLQKPTTPASDEKTVEAGLGRKRCITFVCGGEKDVAKLEVETAPKTEDKPVLPPKRPSTIKFACPTRPSSTQAPAQGQSRARRSPTPPPAPRRLMPSPKPQPRAHRDSDSTIRNESPKSVRKIPPVIREQRYSDSSDIGRTEATRFHEFASSEEEVDEWTEEQTCHRRPLTVNDTFKNENEWRKLVEEVEEETLEEEEALDAEGLDDDDDGALDEEDDDDEDEEEDEIDDIADEVSDDGFQTDDEEGFAVSDNDSDADSEYNFWTPGKSTAATSIEPLDLTRPANRRSASDSSISSAGSRRESLHSDASKRRNRHRKQRAVHIGPGTPDLPDSTDFVCGTLDEDRPLEDAYITKIAERRAAKQKITPQDIDPTFPASDPEMDEEDEDSDYDNAAEESEHPFMHGDMESHDSEARGRRSAASKRRSPTGSPKRLKSPPPPSKRGPVHRSPPPRNLFGQSPRRLRSPPPNARLRSPPPTRRTSLTRKPEPNGLPGNALAERPRLTHTASLPRRPTHLAFVTNTDDNDEDNTPSKKDIRARGAIDIVKGLERKRQRRKEKLYQKYCRKSGKDREKRPQPGKGAERMREVGLELAAYRGKSKPFMPFAAGAEHILSV